MPSTVNSKHASDHVAELKQRIIEAAERVVAAGPLGPDDAQFHRARYDLYALAGADVSARAVHALATDTGIRALSRDVFPISCEAGIREECQLAAALLREPNLTFGKIHRAYHGPIYESLMADELAFLQGEGGLRTQTDPTLAAQSPPAGSVVAYIGGGALPIPAMLLVQRIGCQVVVVDPHEPSVTLARALVARVGLDHLVRVVCDRGETYDYAGCDLVFVANWIPDKKPIFRHLARFPSIRHFIFRSVPGDSLSFIINDVVEPRDVCEQGFVLRHQTRKRPGVSLTSLIFSLPSRSTSVADSEPSVKGAPRAETAPRSGRSRHVASSVTELIGNTPMLRLDPEKTGLVNIDLYAKLEHLNPFGSIKDRTAWAMLRPHLSALKSQNKHVLELSSGNAARALQAVASLVGSRLETITNRIRLPEMRKMLALQGAKVSPVLADIDPADALAALFYVDARADEQRASCVYTDQYRNPNNDGTHYATTAREILEDVGRVDYFFTPIGTAGSSIGISRRLREANDGVKVTGIVSTKDSAIPGIRHMDEIFYIGPFEEQKYDHLVGITADEAIDGVLSLIRDYGLMAGPSSGASYRAAIRALRAIDPELSERKTAVLILCDRVELYLSWIEDLRPSLFTD